jgi:hypothetical protein
VALEQRTDVVGPGIVDDYLALGHGAETSAA